jgi:hypothetical protein
VAGLESQTGALVFGKSQLPTVNAQTSMAFQQIVTINRQGSRGMLGGTLAC